MPAQHDDGAWRHLKLARAGRTSPVGAALLELGPDQTARLADRAGDRLFLALDGTFEVVSGSGSQLMGTGDAAVVYGAGTCTVRTREGAQALSVWLDREAEGLEPHAVVQRAAGSVATMEFNTRFRRLPLLPGSEPHDWGSALAHLAPLQSTTPHHHIDDETFIIVRGRGRLRVGTEDRMVAPGDVVHLPSGQEHTLENLTPSELTFFTTWWTEAGAMPPAPSP